MITEVDLGWMAGIISIKGRIQHKKNQQRATTQKVISVRTQRKSIIDRLAILTDRNVRTDRMVSKGWEQRGCVEHCPDSHIHHRVSIPETYEWSVTGISAAIIMHNLMPYMHGDEWRELMIQCLAEAVHEGPGSGATKAAVRRLNNLGWRLPAQVLELLGDTAATRAG